MKEFIARGGKIKNLEKHETKIGPLDDAGRSAIRDRLYTAGELLRLGQLTPDLLKRPKPLLHGIT